MDDIIFIQISIKRNNEKKILINIFKFTIDKLRTKSIYIYI